MNVAEIVSARSLPNQGLALNAISAMEAQARADGFIDADGFFTQSDDEFEAETAGWVEARPMPLAA